MSITKNIQLLQAELPQGVRLVAVSKYHPNEAILEAYNAGQRVFGESKVQEMVAKYEALPKDIEWHFYFSYYERNHFISQIQKGC